MLSRMGLVAAVSILAGCTSTASSIPYESYGPDEARCVSIRQFTPLHERGTRKDPNAEPGSPCRAYPERLGPEGYGRSIPSPFRAFFDAAIND